MLVENLASKISFRYHTFSTLPSVLVFGHFMHPEIHPIGFGAENSAIKIYIANRPSFDDYPFLTNLRGIAPGEISHIVKNTSNHWRKVFNVYAKFLFDFYTQHDARKINLAASWQEYRDLLLFQANSHETLLFNRPAFDNKKAIHIIAGKTYAAALDLPPLIWLDNYFAVNKSHRLIVSPYPDYRQLSNARIAQLIEIIKTLT